MDSNLIKELKEVDRYLSVISASGDDLMLLAQARIKLKGVYDNLTSDHEYNVKEK